MRSLLVTSIGLALLGVGLLILTTLYIDTGFRYLSQTYQFAVDKSIGLIPGTEVPPFRRDVSVFVTTGIPVFPGSYLFTVDGDGEVYIYDDRDVYIVEGVKRIVLDGYFYRVSAIFDPGESMRLDIKRVDGDVSMYVAALLILGLSVSLLGVGGWRGLSRSRG